MDELACSRCLWLVLSDFELSNAKLLFEDPIPAVDGAVVSLSLKMLVGCIGIVGDEAPARGDVLAAADVRSSCLPNTTSG